MAFSNVRALKCPGLCNLRWAKSNSWLNNAQNLFIMILYELCARYNTIGFEELTKMEEPRTDRRVRKTKRQLRMALTTLMMEKSVGEITVREIAELADVNRGTFYAHYKDVYDLLTQLEETIFVRLEEISVINSSPDWDQSTYHYLEDVLKLCYDSADVYRALICRNNDMDFQQRLFETLKNQYMRSFLERTCSASGRELDLFCSFAVQGMLSITKEWMDSGLKESPAEMAKLGGDFIMRGVAALRGN